MGFGWEINGGSEFSIGSYTIGSKVIGSGGEVTAHPFEIDFPIHTDKFERSARFQALNIGHAESTATRTLSPRARPGALVSMPLNWSQVKAGLDPQRFTMQTAPALLRKTKPWQDYCDGERSLKEAIETLVKIR